MYKCISFVLALAAIAGAAWLYWVLVYPLARKTGAIKGAGNEEDSVRVELNIK